MTQHLVSERNSNNTKTFMMMTLSFGVVVLLGYILAGTMGNPSILTGAIVGAVAMNLISYFFSDKIALSSAGAVPAARDKYSELYAIVESLSEKAKLSRVPAVYIINEAGPNAFATGRNESRAAVAVTSGLLATLNRSELEGVIAHELAHIKNKDVLIMTVMVVLAGVLSMMAQVAMSSSFASRGDGEGQSNPILGFAIGIVAAIVLPMAASLIQMSISRKREFVADASGSLYTGYPEALASALKKISGYKQPLAHAGPATAHLYISCPFGGVERQGFMQKLFMTHPPIEARVKALTGEIL